MNTTTAALPNRHAQGKALSWAANGSVFEAFGAIATLALAIVGLAGVFSATMAAIGVILIGAAILMESDLFGGLWAKADKSFQEENVLESPNAQLIGGLTGIVLGILALLGVSSATLLSVAILMFGATFLLSGVVPNQSGWLAHASGGEVLVGLAIIVLGLLALIGLDSMTLVLAALVALSASAFFSRFGPAMRAMAQHS
jgi:hypothetical protein